MLLHPYSRWIIIFVLTAGVIVTGGMLSYRALAKVFTIQRIVVIGNRHLTGGEVIALMKIKRGYSLFKVSSNELSRRLLNSPWIKDVTIRKEPPHTLIVKMKEARPLALLKKKGELYILSREGKVLERIGKTAPFLPVIELKKEDKRLLKEALRLASVINRGNYFSDKKVEIIAKKPEDIVLVVDGLLIKVGKGEYDKKLRRFVQIQGQINRRGIPVEYIDLRFSRRVIIRASKRGLNE